ncbi:MAG: AsmA family protein [bacterium]
MSRAPPQGPRSNVSVGRPALRRALRTILAVGGLLLVLALLLVLLFEWNWLRRPIERWVTASTGRELLLAGDMSGRWSLKPTLTFRGVRYANPAWAEQPYLLEAEEISVTIDLGGMLRRPRVVEAIEARGARIALETAADDRRSWRFDASQSDPASVPVIRRLAIDGGEVRYLDAAARTDVRARIGSMSDGSSSIDVAGHARGMPVVASLVTIGATEALGAATDPGAPAPALRGKGTLGDARITFSGRLGPGYAANGTRLKVTASGPDLSAFRPLARAAIPATPPYRIDADVAIEQDRATIVLRPSTFGASRLQGSLDLSYGGGRAKVVGRMSADPLDLADLGPLMGAAGDRPAAQAARQGPRRILPQVPFDTALWPNVDMDLTLDAVRVVDAGRWAIDAFSFRAVLEEGTLTVSPLSISMAGGSVAGNLSIERRGKAVMLRSDARFQRLQLARLLPSTDATKAGLGQVNGSVELSGEGTSPAGVLAAGNGRLVLAMGPGKISNLLLEVAGLDGGEAVRFLLGGDRRSELRCAVAALPVRAGMVTAEAVVIDTDDTLIAITGSADLKAEQLDFTLHAQPKDWSLFSVRSPIHFRGPFSRPRVSVDAKALGLRAAATILLGLVNPLAALIPLVETGGGEDADCRELLRGVKAGAGAGPAGKDRQAPAQRR